MSQFCCPDVYPKSDCPDLGTILELLKDLPILSATWLASSVSVAQRFIPTHVKHVQTSVPKDMKVVKQRRKEEKTLKKEMRRFHTKEVSKEG